MIKARYGTSLDNIVNNPFATLLQIITLLQIGDEEKIPIVVESIKLNMQTSIARILLAYYALTNQKIFKLLYDIIVAEQLDLLYYALKFGIQYTDKSKLVDPELLFKAYQENILFRNIEQKQNEFVTNNIYAIIRDKLPYVDVTDAWQIYYVYGFDFEKELKKQKNRSFEILRLDWTKRVII
jgi:hypothetical protein